MNVLIGCERSGIVRNAFLLRGHDAWSCDLSPGDYPPLDRHYQGDLLDILDGGWDLLIAHPPCTDLAVSGAKHFRAKGNRQAQAVDFVWRLMNAPIPKICIENPISVLSSELRKPDQIIQPWMFGHPESKRTCLWLKGLPKLELNPSQIVVGADETVWKMGPSPDRARLRSQTYQGIADAMAEQWG